MSEENAAVVRGSLASFGTWSIADKIVTLKLDGVTFPNWMGTTQLRPISSYSPDEIRWGVAVGTAGGKVADYRRVLGVDAADERARQGLARLTTSRQVIR